jgi:hypothetical protein
MEGQRFSFMSASRSQSSVTAMAHQRRWDAMSVGPRRPQSALLALLATPN